MPEQGEAPFSSCPEPHRGRLVFPPFLTQTPCFSTLSKVFGQASDAKLVRREAICRWQCPPTPCSSASDTCVAAPLASCRPRTHPETRSACLPSPSLGWMACPVRSYRRSTRPGSGMGRSESCTTCRTARSDSGSPA
eukprot:3144142-Prymnesium_polylepis.1